MSLPWFQYAFIFLFRVFLGYTCMYINIFINLRNKIKNGTKLKNRCVKFRPGNSGSIYIYINIHILKKHPHV